MTKNTPLLPCPFCGSSDIEVIYDDGYSVGCKSCSTYVAPFLGNEADSRQKHVDFWNTRANCALSLEEVQQLKDALWKARCDIWQTIRVSEYNLTGKDPNFPSDAPDAVPNPPKLIHRAGLDGSYAVFEEVCEALKMLSGKANQPSTPAP